MTVSGQFWLLPACMCKFTRFFHFSSIRAKIFQSKTNASRIRSNGLHHAADHLQCAQFVSSLIARSVARSLLCTKVPCGLLLESTRSLLLGTTPEVREQALSAVQEHAWAAVRELS